MKLWVVCLFFLLEPFFTLDLFWGFFLFCFSLFQGENQTQVQVVQVYDYLYVQ